MDLNKLNMVKVVEAAFTFPNRKAPEKSTGIIIFRDNNNHPFLIYIEKMDSSITIAQIQEDFSMFGMGKQRQDFEYSNKIMVNDNGVVFTLIDLDPPKPMTKEQIEKILGYKINILT